MYCETIGLTAAWINAAAPSALSLACYNVGLASSPNLRDSLIKYIQDAPMPSVPGTASISGLAASLGAPAPGRRVIDLT